DSRKDGGALKGYGLDELFQTAKTPYFLRWSAGLLKGKVATSQFKMKKGTVDLTVLQLQEHERLDTSLLFVEEERCGHTGAYREQTTAKGYITKGQDQFHKRPPSEIENSSTPRNAAVRAMHSTLQQTAKRKTLVKRYKTGVDVKNRDFSDA